MTVSATRETEQPAYVPGHGLLAGKVVVVTAAGGRGSARAVVAARWRRARDVVLSDTHERRLAEARRAGGSSAPTG